MEKESNSDHNASAHNNDKTNNDSLNDVHFPQTKQPHSFNNSTRESKSQTINGSFIVIASF